MYAIFPTINLRLPLHPESPHHGLPRYRLAKEQKMYAQENQDQKLKLDKLAANDADGWELKNGVSSNPKRFVLNAEC